MTGLRDVAILSTVPVVHFELTRLAAEADSAAEGLAFFDDEAPPAEAAASICGLLSCVTCFSLLLSPAAARSLSCSSLLRSLSRRSSGPLCPRSRLFRLVWEGLDERQKDVSYVMEECLKKGKTFCCFAPKKGQNNSDHSDKNNTKIAIIA